MLCYLFHKLCLTRYPESPVLAIFLFKDQGTNSKRSTNLFYSGTLIEFRSGFRTSSVFNETQSFLNHKDEELEEGALKYF